MLTQTKKGNVHTVEFSDIESLYDFVKDTPKGNLSSDQAYDNIAFTKTESFEEALSLFRNGWPEGTAQIDHALSMIETEYEGTAQAYQFDVSGLMVDVGTYLTGQPECWLSPVEEHAEKSAVTVQVQANVNASVSADALVNRGGAIMAVIDHLAKTHIVDIEVIMRTRQVNRTSLEIKTIYRTNTERSYSKDTLAFMIAHPSYLRRIGFALYEKITGESEAYGHAESIELYDQKGYFFDRPDDNYGWETPAKAAEQVKQFLESRKEK